MLAQAPNFEEFIDLISIKEQSKELESMDRLYASFSENDFIAHEAKMRKKHKQEAEVRERAKAFMIYSTQ